MIHFNRLSAKEEYFAWTDGRAGMNGRVHHFAMTRLNAYLAGISWPVTQIALDPALLTSLVKQNGIEPEHLERITPERLEEPATLLAAGDGTHIVADGAHRLIRRGLEALHFAPAWLVPEKVWRRFVIEGMPGDADRWRAHLRASNPLS